MTEVSVLFTDTPTPWYQSADVLRGYIWIVQNGQVVGGDQEVESAVNPGQTGDTTADIEAWIVLALQDIMGAIVPDPTYAYGSALNTADTWGIQEQTYGNSFKTKPFVAVAYTNDFQFGTLNIPTFDVGGPRQVYFRITGLGDTSDKISPAYNAITNYVTAEAKPLILLALEMKAE